MSPDQPPTPLSFAARLDRISGHVARADEWATEKLRLLQNLNSVSIQFGAEFFLQVGITLTWSRNLNPSQERKSEMSQELSKALLLSAPPVKEETVRRLSLFTGFSFSSLLTAVLGYAEQLPWSTILTVVEDIVNTVSPTASWSEVLAFIVAELDKLLNKPTS